MLPPVNQDRLNSVSRPVLAAFEELVAAFSGEATLEQLQAATEYLLDAVRAESKRAGRAKTAQTPYRRS